MAFLLRISGLLQLAAHLLIGALLTFLFAPKEGAGGNRRFEALTRWWHRRLCRIFRLRIHTVGEPAQSHTLLVANHISWLDIPVLGGMIPLNFVAKSEVRRWPLIGWLAARAGTLFMERGNASSRATETVARHIDQGKRVLIFPEGTTTDGHGIRRFHARLFGTAIEARRPIQAVAIRYKKNAGLHPDVPFVDDQTLVSHIWRLLGSRSIRAEITFCAPSEAAGEQRRDLAEKARSQIVCALDQGTTQAQPKAGENSLPDRSYAGC